MKKIKTKKFRFKQDNDCHWFLIPSEMNGAFDTALECAAMTDDYDQFNDEFGAMTIDGDPGFYEFENPKGVMK